MNHCSGAYSRVGRVKMCSVLEQNEETKKKSKYYLNLKSHLIALFPFSNIFFPTLTPTVRYCNNFRCFMHFLCDVILWIICDRVNYHSKWTNFFLLTKRQIEFYYGLLYSLFIFFFSTQSTQLIC